MILYRQIFDSKNTKAFDYDGYYLIVLTKSILHPHEIILRILQDCWARYAANVYILMMLENQLEGLMYTFFPFTKHRCEHVEPVVVNYFNDTGFKRNFNVFVKKFNNLHNCNIHVGASNYYPYTFVTMRKNEKHHLGGIEGRLLNELSRVMNFTLNVKYTPPDLGFGTILLESVLCLYLINYNYRQPVNLLNFLFLN